MLIGFLGNVFIFNPNDFISLIFPTANSHVSTEILLVYRVQRPCTSPVFAIQNENFPAEVGKDRFQMGLVDFYFPATFDHLHGCCEVIRDVNDLPFLLVVSE